MAESAAYARRGGFLGGCVATTIPSGLAAGVTSAVLADASTWAGLTTNGNARLMIGREGATPEEIEISDVTGNNITISARGLQGTSDTTHAAGVSIEVIHSPRDFNEANAHIADTNLDHHTQYLTQARFNSGNLDLAAIEALTSAADKVPYSTGAQAWALATLTSFARTLLDDADAATARATLGVSSALLAVVSYNPGTYVEVTTESATFADVDATNLKITFTAPASGKVLVHLTADAFVNATVIYRWGLRESTTDLADPQRVASSADGWRRAKADFYITGLTPGASYTYKWSHACSGPIGAVGYGSDGSAQHGPAVLEVWAAP